MSCPDHPQWAHGREDCPFSHAADSLAPPETPSLIEAVEQFIAAAESYRCASAPIADKFVILESEVMLARNRLRLALLAAAVSHPQPEVKEQ